MEEVTQYNNADVVMDADKVISVLEFYLPLHQADIVFAMLYEERFDAEQIEEVLKGFRALAKED